MSAVFRHGQLRLYLLKLLEHEPHTGYDMIRLLEDRFQGLYAPSTGTIYPRLQRLETEKRVERERVGGRSVYRITDSGRAELDSRRAEVVALEESIEAGRRELNTNAQRQARIVADQLDDELRVAATELLRSQRRGLGDEVRGAIGDVRQGLRQVVRRRRFAAGRPAALPTDLNGDDDTFDELTVDVPDGAGGSADGDLSVDEPDELDRRVDAFVDELRAAAGRTPAEKYLPALDDALAEALRRFRRELR